jgi:probable addiction module antidote protein
MAKTKTKRWDAADYLKSDRDVVAYLEAALEDGDSGVVAAALGDIARAKGMTKVARQAGLGRESLYKALSADGNPELGTVLRVVRALGIKLHAVPAREPTVGAGLAPPGRPKGRPYGTQMRPMSLSATPRGAGRPSAGSRPGCRAR